MERATGPPRSCSCALARWVPPSRCSAAWPWAPVVAVLVSPERRGLQLLATPKALAPTRWRREEADLVLFGQQSSDGGGSLLWSAVAERLGQGAVFPAAEVVLGEDSVRVTRQSESADDVIDVALPAVVGVSDSINQPRYASLRGKMGAKKKPLEVLWAGDLGLAPDEVGDAGSKTTVLGLGPPPPRGSSTLLEDQDTAAQAIVDFLVDKELPMKPLVLLEHDGTVLSSGSLGVLSKAVTFGDPVAAALIGGPRWRRLAATAGAHGARVVHVVSDAAFADPLPGPRVDALAALVASEGYDTVLFANSVLAGDVAGALAARLEAGLNWDLVDLAVAAATRRHPPGPG